jgi:hypothetical protein
MEEFVDSQDSSSLIFYFSSILGFSPNTCNILPAGRFAPCLSRLIYILNGVVIDTFHSIRQWFIWPIKPRHCPVACHFANGMPLANGLRSGLLVANGTKDHILTITSLITLTPDSF